MLSKRPKKITDHKRPLHAVHSRLPMLESSQVLAVGTLLGERGGNVGLKQVEKNEFNISAFSSLVLAVILPWFRTGMELCFLFRYFTADQNFLLLLWGSGS